METLVLVSHHRNQYYIKSRDINCRTFQSGSSGILPTPFCTTPVTKRGCSYSSSPKTPSPSIKSSATPIPIPINVKADPRFHYSELWAGPAYSNSPPPSSLPIPKFSVRPKRTVSLDLPALSASDINFHPIAKSAPSSPTRDYCNSSSLFHSADSATKTLRRILNLDIVDE